MNIGASRSGVNSSEGEIRVTGAPMEAVTLVESTTAKTTTPSDNEINIVDLDAMIAAAGITTAGAPSFGGVSSIDHMDAKE